MSSLSTTDRYTLEKFLEMSSGYVLNFNDSGFGQLVYEAVSIDIHDEKYATEGSSKAKKLRSFWKQESDYLVGKLLIALIDYATACTYDRKPEITALAEKCRAIGSRLLAGAPTLDSLKVHAKEFDANHLADQIRRLEASIEADPGLAIGTAKELIETCCRTILEERGKPVTGTPDVSALTKETLKELKLVPDGIPDAARGADTIKRLLQNLGTIGNGLAELRNLYGSGHGKNGKSPGLSPRHARLAVGAASTLAVFLFATHKETKP